MRSSIVTSLFIGTTGLALVACGGNSSGGGVSGTPEASASAASVTAPPCATGSLTIAGSTALQPLVQKAADAYSQRCPGAQITVGGGGSSAGLSKVAGGQADIGDSDVPISVASSLDATGVTDHQVAIAVFAVIVNPQAGVTKLTLQQVRDVFSGKVTSWKEVGGKDVPATLIERKSGSGTRLTFDKTVMKGESESRSPSSTQDSTQLVVQGVAGAPGGASYVGAASAGATVVKVALDGVEATGAGVAAGTYPLFSHEHMYVRKGAPAIANSFVGSLLASDFQSTAVSQLGYLPLATTSRQSAADH